MTSCVPGRFSQFVPVALDEVRHGVEPERVHAQLRPEAQRVEHLPEHLRVLEVEVRLVAEEPVPVVLLRLRIPGPVRLLGVGEDDAGVPVLLVGVAPDVERALRRAGRRAARALEPGVLVGGVVHHELDEHADPARVRRRDQLAEVLHRPVVGVDAPVVGDVVAVVLERRREERQEPQAGDAEVLEVVELLHEPAQIADAVAVRVVERLHVRLVDDGVLVPERILAAPSLEACHRDVPDLLPPSKCAPGARKRRIPRGAPRAARARGAARSGERAAAVQVIAT